MSKPLVSILMPVYNAEPFIEQSIKGVLNQQFTDFEFILINDGSLDGTHQKILSFKDSRIKYVENDVNKGIVYSLNKGLTLATGTYIVRTDADDIALPHMVKKLTAYMENHPDCVVCGGNMKLIGGDRLFLYPEGDEDLKIHTLSACPFSHSTVIFRLSALRELNIYYDASFKDAEDYALWSALLPLGKFHNLQEVTLLYRESTSQVTSQLIYSGNRLDSLRKIFSFHATEYFNLSSVQTKCYVMLMEGQLPKSITDVRLLSKLIQHIQEHNHKEKMFSENKLRNAFFIKWHSVCLRFQSQDKWRLIFEYVRHSIVTGNSFELLHGFGLVKQKLKMKIF